MTLRVGVAHHFGWAVAVTASDAHVVVDRRTIELVADGLSAAPVHHEGGQHGLHAGAETLPDEQLAALVRSVEASVAEMAAAGLDEIASSVNGRISSVSLRSWPDDFPEDIAVLRRAPFESQADSVMYRRAIAAAARQRGWSVHLFDAKTVEAEAASLIGERGHEVLHGPRRTLGPPWTKDHRVALAATVLAANADS